MDLLKQLIDVFERVGGPVLAVERIPADEMASPECEDYVRHFCGLNCLRRWETRRAQFTRE